MLKKKLTGPHRENTDAFIVRAIMPKYDHKLCVLVIQASRFEDLFDHIKQLQEEHGDFDVISVERLCKERYPQRYNYYGIIKRCVLMYFREYLEFAKDWDK